jgi:hypothetical protein
MLSGLAAIDYLALSQKDSDSSASSHWKQYHSTFKFTGNGFEGLQGFGGYGKPSVLLSFAENIMQIPYRKMAGKTISSLERLAKEITKKQERRYDLDVLRQALTISFLHEVAPSLLSDKAVACIIGDGFASMTALLLASKSANTVIIINLTKILLVDLWYLKIWMGEKLFDASVDLVRNKDEFVAALAKPIEDSGVKVIAIEAVNHELLRFAPIDFVINIASMQEMNPSVIAEYFEDLRGAAENRKLIFYCANRKEKKLPDGTVTKFSEYPWGQNDEVLAEGLCPWHQKYYSFIPPFYREYDGPILHKLVRLSGP